MLSSLERVPNAYAANGRAKIWKRVLFVALSLACAALGALWIRGAWRLSRRYTPALAPVVARPDARARGEHLSHTYGCRHCHGENLGGMVVEDSPLMLVTGPNLTPASHVVARYRPADWTRAILHGVNADGRPLLLMPSHHLRVLSDEDVAALATYLADCPKVNGDPPPSEVRLLGQLLLGAGAEMLAAEQIDHQRARPAVRGVALTVDAAHGAYLARACAGCHGQDLQGGPALGPPGSPAPPAISRQVLRDWSKAEFVRVLREGKGRDGRALDPMMPWQALRHMTDDEISALWLALHGEG